MSAEEYAALLAKLQGNGKCLSCLHSGCIDRTYPDVDAKIDAVGKLQVLLDTEGFEVRISLAN